MFSITGTPQTVVNQDLAQARHRPDNRIYFLAARYFFSTITCAMLIYLEKNQSTRDRVLNPDPEQIGDNAKYSNQGIKTEIENVRAYMRASIQNDPELSAQFCNIFRECFSVAAKQMETEHMEAVRTMAQQLKQKMTSHQQRLHENQKQLKQINQESARLKQQFKKI